MSWILAALNAIVAALNAKAYHETHRASDLWATVAWVGSMLYWMIRGLFA